MNGPRGFDVDVKGVHETQQMLGGVARRAAYPRRAYDRVVQDFGRQMGQVFASQGAAAHHRWAPLSDETLERKSSEGQSPQILQATGRLRASLVGRGADHVADVGPEGVTLGTRVPYAIPAQYRKGVPTRAISVPPHAQDVWVEWVTAEVVEGQP